MSALAAPFRQLVERRLWPLAVLLLAAAAAVPMLLSREAKVPAATASAAPAGTAKAALATQPIVTVGDGAARDAQRKVLGSRKDPFKPKVKAKKAGALETTKIADAPAAGTKDPECVTVYQGAQSGSNPVALCKGNQVAPGAPITPAKVYETFSLTVKWGETSQPDLKTSNIKRLKAFPSAAFPAVIYLGLLDDHKTAVFLVDHAATVQGDGRCLPSAQDCQTLHMRKGDIAFIDTTFENQPVQFQLEIVKIRRKRTANPSANKAEAKGGRNALRARMGRLGGLRYDAKSGTLRRAK